MKLTDLSRRDRAGQHRTAAEIVWSDRARCDRECPATERAEHAAAGDLSAVDRAGSHLELRDLARRDRTATNCTGAEVIRADLSGGDVAGRNRTAANGAGDHRTGSEIEDAHGATRDVPRRPEEALRRSGTEHAGKNGPGTQVIGTDLS